MNELTEDDYAICIAAITKCQTINEYVKSGLPVTLTNKNFGFTNLTPEELTELLNRLECAACAAWLNETHKSELPE